jgi:hypothetical protein
MADSENRRRVPRYGLAVDVELTDLVSGIQLKGQTTDVSLFGFGVVATSNLPQGAKIKVVLIRKDDEIVAFGRVVYAQEDLGMGIAYTHLEPKDQHTLTEWIEEIATLTMPCPSVNN